MSCRITKHGNVTIISCCITAYQRWPKYMPDGPPPRPVKRRPRLPKR